MIGNAPETIRFEASMAGVSLAVAATRAFVAGHALDDDLAMKLAIVIEELATNLVEHGEASGTFADLSMAMRGRRAAVTLSDAGIAFDPRHAVTSAIPPERGGGAGLALVRAWADMTGYTRSDDRNHLALIVPGRGATAVVSEAD